MSIFVAEYLRHIVDEARFLESRTAGISLEKFLSDEVLKRACVRSLEVIGEASKRVPDAVRGRYPDVEWRRMAAMRDRLIHGYFGTDYAIVFEVATQRAGSLAKRLEEVIKELEA
jgi:uncharacterized protein with HEPN domain